jgi:hypothetical protein
VSHFTRIKTTMTVKEYLILALRDLGYVPEEGRVEIRGYAGRRTAVEIKIPNKSRGYDIGFRKEKDGYELIADWWGIRDVKQKPFTAAVTQRYAYHAARAKLEEQGFTLINEEKQPDGQIHLVLRRMV